jgi:hypothetical protein
MRVDSKVTETNSDDPLSQALGAYIQQQDTEQSGRDKLETKFPTSRSPRNLR